MKKALAVILSLICLAALPSCGFTASAENAADDDDIAIEEIIEDIDLDGDIEEDTGLSSGSADVSVSTARQDLIDRIVELGRRKFEETGGKSQRAHYSGDIYVCKNFTVYLFRENRDDFRMAEFPDVPLVIPDNLPAKDCKPYAYGFLWKDIPASQGNPFEVAAQFIYDPKLSKDENMEKAREFMRQAQRGDYFQMSAEYEYGTGAHSAIMLGYDPDTDEIHWMDSNMRGGKKNGIRYGIVQFDEIKSVDWWAKAFCHKNRGATLYRLRDDIIYKS